MHKVSYSVGQESVGLSIPWAQPVMRVCVQAEVQLNPHSVYFEGTDPYSEAITLNCKDYLGLKMH